MLRFRSLLLITLFVVGAASMYTAPQHVALAAPNQAFVRYLFASSKYADTILELNGTQLIRQQSGTVSTYLAVPADTPLNLAMFGLELGGPGPVRVSQLSNVRLVAGSTTLLVARDDGSVERLQLSNPTIPAGKTLLRPLFFGQAPSPTLTFDGATVEAGTDRLAPINPQTARLEVREFRTGRVVAGEYLRAQPNYRYDIIVVTQGSPAGAHYTYVVAPVSPQLQARTTETRRFAETGHILEGRLREYWESTGGLSVFGFPLNDDHLQTTPEGSFVTQVFERNRFEYHPEQRAPYDVLLGRLGDERLRQAGRDWRREYGARPIGAGCAAMTTDGRQFAVCEPFISYYRNHGLEFDGRVGYSPAESLALFGLPLTQASTETNSSGDRVLTQWFERARFEYHPNNPRDQQVLLGRLGAEVYGLVPYTFDDEDRAFRRSSRGSSPDWQEASGGFGGHFWWTCAGNFSDGPASLGSLLAEWRTQINGDYEVQVFIPSTHANATPVYLWAMGHDGVITSLDQAPHSNAWVRLADASASIDYRVVVGNQSAIEVENNCRHQAAADAIRFVPRAAR